jgi:hypothetical protein
MWQSFIVRLLQVVHFFSKILSLAGDQNKSCSNLNIL